MTRNQRPTGDWVSSAIFIGLGGMLVLLPVQFPVLPLNMSPVEVWNLLILPILGLYAIRRGREIRLHYALTMWLILLGSLIGTGAASQPLNSFIAIVKDVYLYIWFVLVAAVFVSIRSERMRIVLRWWAAVAIAHGSLISIEFVFPQLYDQMRNGLVRFGSLDAWRPSGLFENANSAALYQAMGLVPVALSGFPRWVTVAAAALVIFSIVATGSLAATGGVIVGTLTALIGAMAFRPEPGGAKRLLRGLGLAGLLVGLLGGVVLSNADLSARFAYSFYGRFQGSAEGRFSLWERAAEIFQADVPPWGIGPDSYREFDVLRKPLHNDLLAFAIERGWLGLTGLVLLGASAWVGAFRLVRTRAGAPGWGGLGLAIFLLAVTAAMVHAQFHQIFHDRSVWLVLATQQALLTKLAVDTGGARDAMVGGAASGRGARAWSRLS